MTVSQTMATEGRRSPAAPAESDRLEPRRGDDPWRDAAIVLGRQARRRLKLILAAGSSGRAGRTGQSRVADHLQGRARRS